MPKAKTEKTNVDEIIEVEREPTKRTNPRCIVVDRTTGEMECSNCGPNHHWFSRKYLNPETLGELPTTCPNCIKRFIHNYVDEIKK